MRKFGTSLGIVLLLAIIVISSAVGWYKRALLPINSQNSATQQFIVPKGANSELIAKDLVKAKLIRSEVAFKIYLAQNGLSRKLQAGSFSLQQSMTTPEIVQALTKGTNDIWVTVLEGWRREEIAQALASNLNQQGGNFSAEKFLDLTKGKEGYLFPDTYLIPISASEDKIASLLETTLYQKIEPLQADIQASGNTLHQILTMASIIEREAKTPQSRNIVSGILWKRIQHDWPLQVDATLQYIKGYSQAEKTWWQTPLANDKQLESPYNTYKYKGLPPGPISTASLESISAAINPASSDYWYYITGNDGKMYYARTFEQHNQNIQNHLH